MPNRFVATPEVPTGGGLLDWQAVLFSAMKENIELLTGTRGEGDLISRAIVRGDIASTRLGTQSMHTAQHYNEMATADALVAIRNDMQNLANDVYHTRNAFNDLIKELTGA